MAPVDPVERAAALVDLLNGLFGLTDLFGGKDVRPGRIYSSVEAAKLLGTDRKTILRTIRSGALKAAKGNDGNYRISGQAIVDFLSCRDL